MKPSILESVVRRPTVCVMVPACNEAEGLPGLRLKLEELQRSLSPQFVVEYCIVDDGSTDAGPAQMSQAAPNSARCIVLSHTRNRGLGAAFRTGFAHVEADIVCTIDADCSYSPSELCRLIAMIQNDEADIAIASPYHPQGRVDGVEPWRLALSLRCSLLYRVATPLKLHTYTSMCRAYRGSLVRDLRFPSNGFVSTVEILLSAAGQGYRVREVPATLRARTTGASKMRLARTIRTHIDLLGRCAMARLAGRFPQMKAPAKEAMSSLLPVYVRQAAGGTDPVGPVWSGSRDVLTMPSPLSQKDAASQPMPARA